MNDLLFISCFICMDAAGRQGSTARKRSVSAVIPQKTLKTLKSLESLRSLPLNPPTAITPTTKNYASDSKSN